MDANKLANEITARTPIRVVEIMKPFETFELGLEGDDAVDDDVGRKLDPVDVKLPPTLFNVYVE